MHEIATLHPDQWELYRAIRLEALSTDPQAFGTTYAEAAAKPESYWRSRLEQSQADVLSRLLFAMEGGWPVGLVGAYPSDDKQSVNVISMYVRPSYRGVGVARELLAGLFSELQGCPGVQFLELVVHPSQPTAVALYRRFGFRLVEVMESQRSDGTPLQRWRMKRPLHLNP